MKTSFLEKIINNKKLIITTLIVITGFLLLFTIPKKNIITTTFFNNDDEKYEYSDGVRKADTLEKFGFCANENYIIKENADVRRTPNIAMYNTIYKLKFGTKIYTKNIDLENKTNIDVDESLLERETKNNFVAIYSVKPIMLSDLPVGYVAKEDFVEKSEFKNFKPIPKELVPIEIESGIKSTIESNLFIDEVEYQFCKDIVRFNNSIAYGDFNNDGENDFAVNLDSKTNSNSIVLVYFKNTKDNVYDLIYKKEHDTLITIQTINKDAKIEVNDEITDFPLDGFIIKDMNSNTFFHIFNPDNNSFMVFKN